MGLDLIPESRHGKRSVSSWKIVYQLRIAPEGKVVKRGEEKKKRYGRQGESEPAGLSEKGILV